MSEVSRRLIRRAIADLARSRTAGQMTRAINSAYATGMIEIAYAEGLIRDHEHDQFRREVTAADEPEVAHG